MVTPKEIIKKIQTNEMLKKVSSDAEAIKKPSLGDLKSQVKLAKLVETLQQKDKKQKFKEEIKPFWKVYLSFWFNIRRQTNDKKTLERIINNFFTTTFRSQDIEKTFKEIDEGFKVIKSLNVYSKIEKEIDNSQAATENIDKKTIIKYIIKTNTTIGKQFFGKFIERIWSDIRTIISAEEQKNKTDKKSNVLSRAQLENNALKNNIKQHINTINKSLATLENIFLNKLSDLYLDHIEPEEKK